MSVNDYRRQQRPGAWDTAREPTSDLERLIASVPQPAAPDLAQERYADYVRECRERGLKPAALEGFKVVCAEIDRDICAKVVGASRNDLPPCAVPKGPFADYSAEEVEAFAKEYARQHESALLKELCALLPGTYYMDPPDGGDVSVLEQARRMAEDAKRFRQQSNLLDALCAMVLEHDAGGITLATMREARAAIAKATGEKQ